VDRQKNGSGHGQEDEAHQDGHLRPGLELQIDGQGHGLCPPRKVSREGDRRPELAQRPSPRQAHPRPEGGCQEREGDAPEGGPVAGAQRRRHRLVAPVQAPEPRLHGHHQEGHGHEGLCHHHAGGREGQGDSQRLVKGGAENAPASERQEKGHPADHRRKDHGKEAENPEQPLSRELRTGQDPGQGHADHGGEPQGSQRGEQRDPESLAHGRRGDSTPHFAPGGPENEPRQGKNEEARAQNRQSQEYG